MDRSGGLPVMETSHTNINEYGESQVDVEFCKMRLRKMSIILAVRPPLVVLADFP
jgi:hypothetical protein